jgi:hypothetical protein
MALDTALAERFRTDSARIDSLALLSKLDRLGWITALQIGGVVFLDIAPAEPSAYLLGSGRAMPTHWIWRADLSGDSLVLRPLSEAWLSARIDSGRTIIGHEHDEGEVVLTAPPAVLRRFLGRHLTDTLAFPDTGTIHLGRWHPDSAARSVTCPCPQ